MQDKLNENLKEIKRGLSEIIYDESTRFEYHRSTHPDGNIYTFSKNIRDQGSEKYMVVEFKKDYDNITNYYYTVVTYYTRVYNGLKQNYSNNSDKQVLRIRGIELFSDIATRYANEQRQKRENAIASGQMAEQYKNIQLFLNGFPRKKIK